VALIAADVAAAPLELLRERLAELADLEAVSGLLGWDQETMMPPAGVQARADHLATLDRLAHERLTAAEVGEWLAALNNGGGEVAAEATPAGEPDVPADRDAALVRVAERDRNKALRVPPSLRGELARARTLGQHAWARARAADDFAAFLPHLREIVGLTRRYIACFPEVEHPYDAVLDDYEPGMRTAEVRSVFARLRDGLLPLMAAIEGAREQGRAPEPLSGPFAIDAQRSLVRGLLLDVGFDPVQSRLDESQHPFSTTVSLDDQRITARFSEDSLEAMFAGLHEFGHALYDSQVDRALARTPLCNGVSSSVHESQSRLWENMVGRGRACSTFLLPRLRAAFPGRFDELDETGLYRAVNVVRPSLIRIQADEVTYALHIILRFELELELFEGTLEPEQLADAWRERARAYLGVEVPDDAHGVLQDIHWSFGGFGYFPTYALGNLIAAQLWERIRADHPDLDEHIAAGDFMPLRTWLGRHVHRYGRMFTPVQTLRRAIGSDLDPAPFIDYLWAKHTDVHGISRSDPLAG
jgi:carboxypeptidase Taq